MRRVSTVILGASTLLAFGCGWHSYETRLNATIARMEYLRRLDQFLAGPPEDKRFQDLMVFIRPPKGMSLAKTFLMADLKPGTYDLPASFVGEVGGKTQNLHLLIRRKGPKKPPAKGAPPEPAVERGPFEQDVLALLAGSFGASDAIAEPKYQTENKKGGNSFRRLFFNASTGNTVQAYFLKKEPYEVALVWDLPQEVVKENAQRTARELCLQSFALGDRARKFFGGDISEEESSSGTISAPPGATPF